MSQIRSLSIKESARADYDFFCRRHCKTEISTAIMKLIRDDNERFRKIKAQHETAQAAE